jgi:single-strand DNA-binding protein
MPDPQPQAPHQPTRLPSRPKAGSLITTDRLRWLHRLPLGSLVMPRCPPSPGSKGKADRPARHSAGMHHDRAERQLRRQPHRQPRGPLHRRRHRPGHIRVAVSGRREQEASLFTVIVWRDQAEHAAQSLHKGSRVVVVGRLQQRSWTAEDGSAQSVVEVVAEELGPSLRWATATPDRITKSGGEGWRPGGRRPGRPPQPSHLGPLGAIKAPTPWNQSSREEPRAVRPSKASTRSD